MTALTATWKKFTSSDSLKRSSHALSVIENKAYIFGGELKPRQPQDNDLHVLHLNDDTDGSSKATVSPSASIPPPARVGSASTTLKGNIYLYSGRGGPAMTPLQEQGSFWEFDSTASNWSRVSPSDTTLPYPEARSYHALANDGEETLYLHAGCPAQGRLSDLWSFHLPSRRWTQLSQAPDPPRGGTSITVSRGKLYRMHGFDGTTEQGGSVEMYDVEEETWNSLPFPADGKSGPEPRSVSCLLAVDVNHRPSLVSIFGERDPSSQGHEGAGKMRGDVWVFDIASQTWTEAEAGPDERPAARGWFDADVMHRTESDAIVVHGGLDESNERLGDVWMLTLG